MQHIEVSCEDVSLPYEVDASIAAFSHAEMLKKNALLSEACQNIIELFDSHGLYQESALLELEADLLDLEECSSNPHKSCQSVLEVLILLRDQRVPIGSMETFLSLIINNFSGTKSEKESYVRFS